MAIRVKEGLKLRKIGDCFMVVRSVSGSADLSRVLTLNESAAFLWNKTLESGGCQEEQLVEWLLGEYDVEPEIARVDVREMLENWLSNGLIACDGSVEDA